MPSARSVEREKILMSDGAYIRAQVYAAAENLKNSANLVYSEGTPLERISAALNNARREIEDLAHTVLDALQLMRDGKEQASLVLLGTTGMVMEAIAMIQDAEADQTDTVSKLNFLHRELTRFIVEILTVITADKDNDAAKLRAAASHLEGYASTIP
jgi:ABC-type transporter Mla subunit MlaD